jgi:hypothetical protein
MLGPIRIFLENHSLCSGIQPLGAVLPADSVLARLIFSAPVVPSCSAFDSLLLYVISLMDFGVNHYRDAGIALESLNQKTRGFVIQIALSR